MDGINCSVNFLTLKQIGYEESNVAVNFYHDRTHFEQNQRNLYASYTEEFNLQQGRHFVLHNKLATAPSKMSKIKDQIREFDALFNDTNTITSQNKLNKLITRTSLSSNEMNNLFFTYLSSNLIKIIWLAPNRILLIMQDSCLVWLIIDTISGDLIKILTDKSLIGNFGPNPGSTLSGKLICDSALLIRQAKNLSPILIFVYSDKSKVDLITFNKAAQINDYLKNSKELKLDKISTYEPVMTSYEFACPSIYQIEKRISTQINTDYSDISNNNFCVWWPNDGQIVWQPNKNANTNDSGKQTVSLLERDDLRNNVLILSTNLADNNLMEYLFKSDGLLLSLNYLNENNLIAIEQTETNAQKYIITIYRYELPKETAAEIDNKKEMNASLNANNFKSQKSLKIKLTSFSLNSKIASVEQIKISKKYILMLSMDQTLILYEKNRNLVNKFKLSQNAKDDFHFYNGIEWLLEDLIFGLYNLNGQVKLYDIGFTEINMFYLTRYSIKFKSISEYLNPNLFVPFTFGGTLSSSTTSNANNSLLKTTHTQPNLFVKLVSSKCIFTDSLISCFFYSKGPFGLFRLSLPDKFNHISLVNHYLKNSQPIDHENIQSSSLKTNNNKEEDANPFVRKHLKSSVNLLKNLDWNNEPHICLAILSRILNFVLSERVEFNIQTEMLVEEALGSFYKPKRSLLEKTIYEYKQYVSRYARRFFYQLLKHNRLSKAFLLAVDIGAKDLFNDLYYCALDKRENQLAEVCRKKYQEILAEENQKKIANDLNRSITTIDDNIKRNAIEFDRYSVSSSENNSGESENDDSFDSECEYDYLSREQKIQMEKENKFKLNKVNFKYLVDQESLQKPKIPKVYTEEDIENYARNVLNENLFIYQYKFDN